MVESETEAQWQKIIGLIELKLILNITGTASIVKPVPGLPTLTSHGRDYAQRSIS